MLGEGQRRVSRRHQPRTYISHQDGTTAAVGVIGALHRRVIKASGQLVEQTAAPDEHGAARQIPRGSTDPVTIKIDVLEYEHVFTYPDAFQARA